MAGKRKWTGARRKTIIILLVSILVIIGAFRIFISIYLPSLIKHRLQDIIVNGSDSLYRFEMGKINIGFWGNSFHFRDLHVYIDSTKYNELKKRKKLPGLTFDLHIPEGLINEIGLPAFITQKKLKIGFIDFAKADIHLSRHFRSTVNQNSQPDRPLWEIIQPTLKTIAINDVIFRDINIKYNNVDSGAVFSWQFNQCNARFSEILVDSTSARDTGRLLFAKQVMLNARDVKMKTPDGLYNINANTVFYASSSRLLEVSQFGFTQALSNSGFIRHFGYQHEIYNLSVPVIRLRNFDLPGWITYNELRIDTAELESPDIKIYLDRNAKPYPYSKRGNYPQQLLQKAPFLLRIRKLTAVKGTVVYREKNNQNQLTGELLFSGIKGTISNITNDPALITVSPVCEVNTNSVVLNKGMLHSVFRFNLADHTGGFDVSATLTNLNAAQLRPLIKAMTSVEIQSFNMSRLDYSMRGNESSGTGQLQMKYTDMDVLLNKVMDNGSLDKKGFLSFLVNRLVIYKENPKDGEERKAKNVPMLRDMHRSFFNFIWKTLFSASGKIVLRPLGQRIANKKKKKQGR